MGDDQRAATSGGSIAEDRDGNVLLLTIGNAGKKNAITGAMYLALAQALNEAAADDAVKVVVIRGADGVFTSGNDVGDFGRAPQEGTPPPFRFLHALIGFPKPVVAQVEGLAVGIGTTMLLHCDLVYAASDARFQLPFVNLGLVPEAAASYILPRLMGNARAAELILLGEMFTAEHARDVGIVNSVHEPASLHAHVLERARVLAEKAPLALRRSKALLRGSPDGGVPARLEEEAGLFANAIRGPEFAEALQAFRERRKPDFSKI